MPATLNTNQKALLRRASEKAISGTLGRLKKNLRFNRWITASNPYRANPIRMLLTAPPSDPGALAQYIAASCPVHAADGWAYLGRAIGCHIRGDRFGARHLGYYAELRAGMSLLAGQGVGIFDRHHVIIDEFGAAHRLPKFTGGRWPGTHQIVWLALSHWADLVRSADTVSSTVTIGGHGLLDWLQQFAAATNVRVIAKKWLRNWGLDLQRLADDRDARNEASYRPTRLSSGQPLGMLAGASVIREMWATWEPRTANPFETLDRYLLRLSLEEAFRGPTGIEPANDPTGFAARVEATLVGLGFSGGVLTAWRDFLTRSADPHDPSILRHAAGSNATSSPWHHVEVMARATLLLRLSTGVAARLLVEADLDRAALAFWWQSLGEEAGLWEPGAEPTQFTDLWADVEDACGALEQWEGSATGSRMSYAGCQADQASSIIVLGQCERAALWGLGL